MKYRHLNKTKRQEIEILLNKGYKQKEIASVLKVNKSTISREIRKRSVFGKYNSEIANTKYINKRRFSKHQGMKIQKDTVLKKKIIQALENRQSPEGISGRYKNISHVSIYKWLYSSNGQYYCKYLCSRRYKKRKRNINRNKRSIISNLVSIDNRPKEGIHWEVDLFVSPSKLNHSVSCAVLVEQDSQYIKCLKMGNRKPSTMVTVMEKLTKDIQITDLTFDRGIENRYHEQFKYPTYFCDPYSPWQKPHVENNIGLLRKWFIPKKTDLSCMKQIDLDRYVSIVNNKWRKSLGFKSAREVALERGIIKE